MKITVSAQFEKEAKRLIRKYPSLAKEIQDIILKLSQNPSTGTPLGNNCFKIRLAIKTKSKSGGAGVITCLVALKETLVLLSGYDRLEKETRINSAILKLLTQFTL